MPDDPSSLDPQKNAATTVAGARETLVAKRWRLERNWWISTYTLTAWGAFWVTYK